MKGKLLCSTKHKREFRVTGKSNQVGYIKKYWMDNFDCFGYLEYFASMMVAPSNKLIIKTYYLY